MTEVLVAILKILAGLAGLGIIVFVHELGHFIAARAVGIDVDAFSLGWGPPVLKKKIGTVEYRLGAFPVGGYCKMSGESGGYEEAWESHKAGTVLPSGGYFSAAPWRRMIVAFCGPLFNLIFAIFVFAAVWGVGFEYDTMDNRIALASEAEENTEGRVFPADIAGLRTGDRVVAIDGKPVETFSDLQRRVAVSAEKKLRFDVEREGEAGLITIIIEPELQKESGAGLIGVRQGGSVIHYKTPNYSFFGAIAKGGEEAFWMLSSTVRGIRLMFRGIDLTKSVSGPVRITWMAGEAAAEGFSKSFSSGLRLFMMILAIISIALGVTNLLPLPILDGGAIILYVIELIYRRPLHPRIYMGFQVVGVVVIAAIMIFGLFGDILYFVRG